MTKKDYILIAEVLKAEIMNASQVEKRAVQNVALGLAQRFSIDNPRFDYFKFTEACGANS